MLKYLLSIIILTTFLIACTHTETGDQMQRSGNLTLSSQPADTADRNNNFYDNIATIPLPGPIVEITGEVINPGPVNFSRFPKRSVIVKETLLNADGTDSFVGAYRYDGYSIFDILSDRILAKKNEAEFPPVIDLFVEIENDQGEKVVLSWGEIFYPNILHQILVATDVAQIIPTKSKDLWPLPEKRKLVVVSDLITERNLSDPVRITVRSCERTIPINRHLDPLWSPQMVLTSAGKNWLTLSSLPAEIPEETLQNIFYGRGRGIHSTQPFTGFPLKSILSRDLPLNRQNLRQGLVLVVAADGYRCIFSFSEIVNRNDQADLLLVPVKEGDDGGLFRLFPSCDFFSDRAVKAISGIELLNPR